MPRISFSFALLLQQVDRDQGFYQLQVFAQLLHYLSPAEIQLAVPVASCRSGMALRKLRQIHEFKVMTASGSKYELKSCFANAVSLALFSLHCLHC
jgi:lipopolysaccharide export LptBFGC system permease protein LptF